MTIESDVECRRVLARERHAALARDGLDHRSKLALERRMPRWLRPSLHLRARTAGDASSAPPLVELTTPKR